MARHLSLEELQEGLGAIMRSPPDAGDLKAIVIRPEADARIALPQCELSRKAACTATTGPGAAGCRCPTAGRIPTCR